MGPLKTFFSEGLVKRLASELVRAHPQFPDRVFVRDACRGLEAFELLDRGRHIARPLGMHLPSSYPEALEILLCSLGPELASDELIGVGMTPFFYLPHTFFVAKRGLKHFELSMRAQYELTKRFSAEGSIRSYIERDPERAMRFLNSWATDPNAHVRRLVSEGTRLRLPWARRVGWLDRNPDRVLALLELLQDDPSTMVRRSVANNLNDLGKVHPELLVETATTWLQDASPERRKLVEHALRSAVRRGDADALGLLGYGDTPRVAVEKIVFNPRRVAIGGRVAMTFVLRSRSKRLQRLLVDVAVHFVKAHGGAIPKVFKLGRFDLPSGESLELKTRFSLAVHTTRVPRPGDHAVDVVVNGHPIQAGSFRVSATRKE